MNATANTLEQSEEVNLTDENAEDAGAELNLQSAEGDAHEESAKADLSNKATTLKRLVHSLLMEVQSLDSIPTVDFKEGIDFYEEVRRFEIALIQHALAQTGGHQLRAARLLNMKVTTLNSKIKHYNIRLDVLVGGLYAPEAGRNGAREQAS